MDFRTFEQLHINLARFDSPTLFAYLKIKPTASIRESEAGLEARRDWAQDQQGSTEASWFLENFSQLRALLLQSRADYLRFIDAQIRSGGLDQLEMFILGALIHGEFTPLAEIAVAKQAERIGIPADIAEGCLNRILTEKDLVRAGELPDHYSALGIHPLLPHEQLETYYKRRRKWVNNISDRERFRRLSTSLEAAWWVLGDVERRRLYDYQYQRIFPEPPPLSELATITPEAVKEPSTEVDTAADAAVAAVVAEPRSAPLVPKLVVEAPDVIRPRPARQPLSLSIVVKNTGRGEMSGTVRINQPWASVSPTTLDPRQPEQTITVTVDPMAMPEDRGEVQVTVATRRCGNRTVLIEIRRKVYIKQLLTVGAVLTVAALVGFPLLAGLQHMATSTQTHLVVRADPPTGDVLIDGQTLGLGGVIDIHEAFPIGEPFTVRIEASGFQSWEEEVTVPEGELLILTPRLELTDEMTFRPVASDSRAELSLVEVTAAIEPVQSGIDTCISSEMALRGYVSPLGVLIGLEVTSGDSAARDCLARQLRAVAFPRNTTTSYSAFEITL